MHSKSKFKIFHRVKAKDLKQ